MDRLRHKGKYIELLILDTVRDKPIHGYYLLKLIREETGLPVNPGLIYPLLRSLARRGLVKASESSEGGRRRVLIEITEEGRKYLEENKSELEKARRYLEKLRLAKSTGLTKLFNTLTRLVERIDSLTQEQIEAVRKAVREFDSRITSIIGGVE